MSEEGKEVATSTSHTQALSDGSLRNLADQLGPEWEKLATYLGFTTAQIYCIKANNPYHVGNQIFQMLVDWRQREGTGPEQVETLSMGLTEVERTDIACILSGKASEEYRRSLTKDLANLEREVQHLELSLQGTVEAKQVVQANTAKARSDVQDGAAEAIAKVKAEQERLLSEITSQEQEQRKRLDEREKTTIEMLQRKKHILENAKEVTSNASDNNFLSSYPEIRKDLKKIYNQHLAQYHHKLWYLRFQKSQAAGNIELGEVELEGEKWELRHEFGQQGSGEGDFEVARGIAAAADPDEIAVADVANKRVVICDSQGFFKRSLPIHANDVVAVSNQWVCLTPGRLMVYDRDSSAKFSFGTLPESEDGTWLMSATVLPNGSIIVGDKAGKVLTELNPKNGDVIRTVQLNIRPDYLAALSNDWVVISDEDEGLVEIDDVSNDNAVTVTSIRPLIGGKPVKFCRGVCSNNTGIYIAVSTLCHTTNHIHHYDCAGQFVSCVAQGLYTPCGITFTADGQQLVVADWHSVKMYRKV